MVGGSGAMRWPIRQWHRIQLARELLAQHEHDEASRIPWPQALARIKAFHDTTPQTTRAGAASWREAVEAQADRYPNE